jgi:3-methyladenine DNA glycosylase AlkC
VAPAAIAISEKSFAMSKKSPPQASPQAKQEKFSLKDHLFNRQRVVYLASLFQQVDEQFDATGFVRQTMKSLDSLELKQRIKHIAATLENYLPNDFRQAAPQIVAALPPPLDPTLQDGDFGDFIFAPLGEYVVRNGLNAKHLPLSLRTLKQLTQRFSMEDAIRYFLNEFPNETLAELQRWAMDKNYHVRRLVSEGTRPNLPWSARLSLDVFTPLPLLETLHADSKRYVTRSVSNHLNDLSKLAPDRVIETLTRWRSANQQDPQELDWMTRHALRTLVKQGHAPALKLLGFEKKPPIVLTKFQMLTPTIQPGDGFEFVVELQARRATRLVLDYGLDSPRANGRWSKKVFKLKQLELAAGQTATVTKRHVLRSDATTYRLYPGEHRVALQVNGQSFGPISFQLLGVEPR